MSDRYPFTDDKTLITHDGTVVWNEHVSVRSSLDFTNTSLADSMNETYETAVEDETQYLSVLETTSDITLEDLHNLTLEHSKMGTQEVLEFSNEDVLENLSVNAVDMGDQQVVVFTLEGSDDLYGIQLAQDEEGNIQKYQFKFRSTEDGQLEAIPESIELLPNDEETHSINEVLVQEIEADETLQDAAEVYQESEVQETQVYVQQEEETAEEYVELEQEEGDLGVYIKGEHNDEEQEYVDDQEEDGEGQQELHYEETESEVPQEDAYEEEVVDIKTGILEESLAMREAPSNIKQELLQEESQESTAYRGDPEEYQSYQDQEELHQNQYEENPIAVENDETNIENPLEGEGYATVEIEGASETVLEYQQYVPGEIQQVYEGSDTTDSQSMQQQSDHYERLFIQENHVNVGEKSNEVYAREEEEEVDEQFISETGGDNDSDNDDYQIVEGLHITAEGDIDDEPPAEHIQEQETILQEVVKKPPATERANILKQSLLKPVKEIKPKNNKTVVYYVVPHLEKENVNSLPVNNTTAAYRPIRSNPRTILKSSFPPEPRQTETRALADERLNKRFARSKEAVQARLFNNFISKTTIPHAPVRQTRLPRKQQIRPVDARRDEEIIVQEVMVSSKGFVENVEEKLRNKDKLEVTGYVVLTDSDDDYDPKQGNKKKKKHKKHRKMDASDSEDSDVSVIDLRSDDEPEKEEPKRGRGRPRKSVDAKDGAESMKRRRGRPPKADTEESPTKKSRTESDDSTTTKDEVKCPHCPKTFPSQNSLATHIQHHNLENSLRNKANATLQYKHKCDDCQETFKNSILLKRHVGEKHAATKVRTRLECTVCKKTFPDVHTLNVHKRGHVKENLVSNTSTTKISPKKLQARQSTIRPPEFKSTFKCGECSRVCYSQEGLALHEKTHRKYGCTRCAAAFPSRLLLDTHVRVSCVKNASPSNRRLSFKVRKSFVQSPRRAATRAVRRSVLPKLHSPAAGMDSTMDLKLECSTCGEMFGTFQNKFQHQVKVHGLETPDKSLLAEQKRNLHKPKNVHGGIPARDRMRKVFTNLKTKIALVTPTKDAGLMHKT